VLTCRDSAASYCLSAPCLKWARYRIWDMLFLPSIGLHVRAEPSTQYITTSAATQLSYQMGISMAGVGDNIADPAVLGDGGMVTSPMAIPTGLHALRRDRMQHVTCGPRDSCMNVCMALCPTKCLKMCCNSQTSVSKCLHELTTILLLFATASPCHLHAHDSG
jgi:hypothetical protein